MSSRDRRFVAVHRGGPLDRDNHALLARWAADCAERVLPFFEQRSKDKRPALAIGILRSWAAGEVKTGAAMKASLAAHAAAREADEPRAIAAARAAGQAAGTAHCADHCMGALLYALKATAADGGKTGREIRRRIGKLPPQLREQVADGIISRMEKMKIPVDWQVR
ncbi:MAG: hypothetical protein RIQ71_1536 [Verrucomicrobiota bacterium]|jgi:mono/diheme cytochrome c family protein